MKSDSAVRSITRTGGRPATQGLIKGQYALSVGMPDTRPPEGWRWTPLSDVARLESGHTPSRRKPEYWGGDIPWIGIRDATGNHGRVLFDTEQHTNELGIANSSARLLPAHTVCLSRTASVGYVVAMGRPMATSQDFVNWVCGKHIDWRFLKYVLLAEHESYSRFAHGTTHQTIYFPEVKAFHVCLPPVAEQRRIVGVLGALDDKIECSLDLSRHLFQAARLEYTRVARQSPQDEVGRLARILSGKRPVGEVRVTPTASADVPVLGGAGVMGYTDRSLFDEQVLVTGRVGTLGLVHLVNGKCWPSDNTLVLKRASDGACLEWLVFSLEDADLGSLNRGSTQPLLTQSALREVLVPVPDPLHAELYERFAGRLFRLMDHLQREVELLKRLRDELLPKVVSGAIRVPEDYEPAT